MNKKNLVLLVVVVLVALGIWYVAGLKKESAVLPGDNTAAIANELSSLDLGDINSDLQDVDSTINGL